MEFNNLDLQHVPSRPSVGSADAANLGFHKWPMRNELGAAGNSGGDCWRSDFSGSDGKAMRIPRRHLGDLTYCDDCAPDMSDLSVTYQGGLNLTPPAPPAPAVPPPAPSSQTSTSIASSVVVLALVAGGIYYLKRSHRI